MHPNGRVGSVAPHQDCSPVFERDGDDSAAVAGVFQRVPEGWAKQVGGRAPGYISWHANQGAVGIADAVGLLACLMVEPLIDDDAVAIGPRAGGDARVSRRRHSLKYVMLSGGEGGPAAL